MKPDDLHKYFELNPPPPTFDWKPWAKIIDTQQFLKSCFTAIANYRGDYNNCPSYWHIKEFYDDLQKVQKKEQEKSPVL